MQLSRATLLVLFLAAPAGAQNINVDFEPTNTAYGVPTPYYGGSAHSLGVWNSVSAVSVTGLRTWNGYATSVSLTLSDSSDGCNTSAGPFGWEIEPSTSGQAEALLDDTYNPGGGFTTTLFFQGLTPGTYVVDTIIGLRFCSVSTFTGTFVEVLGSSDPVVEVSGGSWAGAYVEGQNFARHTVTITTDMLTIYVTPQAFTDYSEVAAVQLRLGDPEVTGTPLCFGDGSAAACPCANTGGAGRGCENSAGTGGAFLFATGSTTPDNVILHASGERATALSIFLQGNASITPVFYGDGLRCTGGTLKRLYTKNAVAGEATAPELGDPQITVRSAALGVPISPGSRRYYQVFNRDGTAGFCPPPSGSSFNVSSGVRINW